MNRLTPLEVTQWTQPHDAVKPRQVTRELEAGKILFLPRLKFILNDDEARFLAPRWSDGQSKNVSYDPGAAQIRHTSAQDDDRRQLAAIMARYRKWARGVVMGLCPGYAPHLH